MMRKDIADAWADDAERRARRAFEQAAEAARRLANPFPHPEDDRCG